MPLNLLDVFLCSLRLRSIIHLDIISSLSQLSDIGCIDETRVRCTRWQTSCFIVEADTRGGGTTGTRETRRGEDEAGCCCSGAEGRGGGGEEDDEEEEDDDDEGRHEEEDTTAWEAAQAAATAGEAEELGNDVGTGTEPGDEESSSICLAARGEEEPGRRGVEEGRLGRTDEVGRQTDGGLRS